MNYPLCAAVCVSRLGSEDRERRAAQQLPLPVLGQPGRVLQGGVDRADRAVHHRAGGGVVQVAAQLGEQVHPLLQVQPLLAAQAAPIGLGQVRYLPEVHLGDVAVIDDEADLAVDQLSQRVERVGLPV